MPQFGSNFIMKEEMINIFLTSVTHDKPRTQTQERIPSEDNINCVN